MSETKRRRYRHYCQETGQYVYSHDADGHCPYCGSSNFELVKVEG